MLTVAPFSVVLLGVLGVAVVLASVARMVVLERHSMSGNRDRGTSRIRVH